MTMPNPNAQERAEKIFAIATGKLTLNQLDKQLVVAIANELDTDRNMGWHTTAELRQEVAEEREACAKVAHSEVMDLLWSENAKRCAERIEARILSRGEA